MDLADVTETRGDEDALAVLVPAAEARAARVLVTVQVGHDRLRDGRYVLHHQVAVVGLGSDHVGRGGERKTERHQARDQECVSFHA